MTNSTDYTNPDRKALNKKITVNDSMVNQAADKVADIATAVKDSFSPDGVIGSTVANASEKLQEGAEYIKEHGSDAAGQLTDLIRKNPITSLCVGVGVGILLERTLLSGKE